MTPEQWAKRKAEATGEELQQMQALDHQSEYMDKWAHDTAKRTTDCRERVLAALGVELLNAGIVDADERIGLILFVYDDAEMEIEIRNRLGLRTANETPKSFTDPPEVKH
jgi:hypothetical protein